MSTFWAGCNEQSWESCQTCLNRLISGARVENTAPVLIGRIELNSPSIRKSCLLGTPILGEIGIFD